MRLWDYLQIENIKIEYLKTICSCSLVENLQVGTEIQPDQVCSFTNSLETYVSKHFGGDVPEETEEIKRRQVERIQKEFQI
jgi:hypothetical protein